MRQNPAQGAPARDETPPVAREAEAGGPRRFVGAEQARVAGLARRRAIQGDRPEVNAVAQIPDVIERHRAAHFLCVVFFQTFQRLLYNPVGL